MSKNVISLAGRAFKAEPDGNVLISLRQLKGQDLRLLPAGTSIVVSDFRKRHADPIKILKIMDKGMPDFAVVFEYCQCLHCWTHAFHYPKFMDAAEALLRGASSSGITYIEMVPEENGLHHILGMDRQEYLIEDMEAALETEIDHVLDPLMQFALQLDQQVKQQFNV
jgi:hypothetical protein